MTPDDPTAAISRVLTRQREFVARGEARSLAVREEALARLERCLVNRQDELLAALAADLGKPEIEAFFAEYHFLVQEIRHVRRNLAKWLKPRRVGAPFYFQPSRNEVRREPHGVVLIMAPWNYPIQLALSPLLAAIAAGNSVVLKPSELTPASERFLSSLVTDCFDPGHAAVLTGGPEVAELLLLQEFDFLFFTGSTKIGRIVACRAAEHLTPHILELGGKCPCVVDRSADLPITARRILIGKLFNAGQTCFAPDFVAVHEEVREALVKELAAELDRHPWEREMARIVNERHYSRLQELLEGEPIQKGRDDETALHFAPRLLPAATWDCAAMQDEIFGPILPILSFSDREDLIARLRALPTPLALYCFSRDDDFTRALLDRVPSGGVCLNDIGKQGANLRLPFGGAGASGHGRYRGRTGVEAFSRERSVTRRYFLPDWFEAVPPREKLTRFLRRWMR